ncbi:ParB/RepB/Spo0J family partition protein [Limnoglobus roseus]|uniref:ParB/RepB/Spo0J family partition protein n=1 Tax=Limnoglobus roseus TaxID=2598579 RepID=A0A5C1ABU9_9BACT|nr:ParB/RepB/Spo0J family partition protein [Limnoglobus roseus]QEL14498.1 ParB/RepB/Spo0J family partition protein [Limnoglobus roseus]
MEATKARTGKETHHTGDRGSLGVEAIRRNPYQPRKQFDEDELTHLRDSIKTHGVLQPLVVRRVGSDFQLIAGERRLRAAQQAGLKDVPVHIVDFNDQEVFEAALVENIQRADLNPIEKAQGFKDYLEKFKLTQDQLGTKLGLDRSTISNLLGLLTLPDEVQAAVRNGQISLGHAKVLKGVPEREKQTALCKLVLLQGLSVHALEQLVKHQKQETPAPVAAAKKPTAEKTAHVSSLEDDLRKVFASRVEIKVKAKEKGQIVIDFDSNDDFERILSLLNR